MQITKRSIRDCNMMAVESLGTHSLRRALASMLGSAGIWYHVTEAITHNTKPERRSIAQADSRPIVDMNAL